MSDNVLPRPSLQSGFGSMLLELKREIPGAEQVILVDWEGEYVDYASDTRQTQTRLGGAHWAIIRSLAQEALVRHDTVRGAASTKPASTKPASTKPASRPTTLQDLTLRLGQKSVTIHHLHAGYCLVVTAKPTTIPAQVWRNIAKIEARLHAELGLE